MTRNLVAWSNATTNSDSHNQAAGWVRWMRRAASAARPDAVEVCGDTDSVGGLGWLEVFIASLGLQA